VGSGAVFTTFQLMSRGLGQGGDRLSPDIIWRWPTGDAMPSSYSGGRSLGKAVRAAPFRGKKRLLHVPSYVLYLRTSSLVQSYPQEKQF